MPKSSSKAFLWCSFLCLFSALLWGGFQQQFKGFGFGSHFRVHFGVILHTFSLMSQHSKMQPFASEILVLGGAEPPFMHYFYKFVDCVFKIVVSTTFLFDFRRFGLANGVPDWAHFRRFC